MNNLLSVNQVAFILKVHPLSIRRYIKAGKLKAIKLGGNVRIQESALADFQKEVEPIASFSSHEVIQKARKILVRQFDENDPLLRLKGRGASLS